MTGLGIYMQGDEPFGMLNEYGELRTQAEIHLNAEARGGTIFGSFSDAQIKFNILSAIRYILKYGKIFLRRHREVVDRDQVPVIIKKNEGL